MSAMTWLSARQQRVAGVALVAVVGGAYTLGALRSEGFPAAKLQLDDGGVWITRDAGQGTAARFVPEIKGASVAVGTGGSPADVVQDATTVVTVSPTVVQRLDVSRGLAAERVATPGATTVALGGGVLALTETPSGRTWVRRADELGGLDLSTAKPDVSGGQGASAAVGTDGVVHVLSPQQDAVLSVDLATREGDEPLDVTPVGVADLGQTAQIATVGTRVVVLDGQRLLVPGGGEASVGAGAMLQQSGPEFGAAVVADDTGVWEWGFGGEPVRIGAGAPGQVRPVRLVGGNGTRVHSFSLSDRTWRQAGTGAEARTTVNDMPADADPVFRVNRTHVALHDRTNGNAYRPEDPEPWTDWDYVRTVEETDGDDTKPQRQDDGESPLSNDRNRKPDAKDDKAGVRTARTALVPVLANDTDPDGDVLTIARVEGADPDQVQVDIVSDGTQLQVRPLVAPGTAVSFRYVVTDGRPEGSDTATVTLLVKDLQVNTPPRQVRKTPLTVATGAAVTTNVLTDWYDDEGDALFLDSASSSAGTVETKPDGTLTLTAGKQAGAGRIDVAVTDGRDPAAGVIDVTVKEPGTAAPVVKPDIAFGSVGQPVVVQPLLNDTDPDGGELSLLKAEAIGEAAGAQVTSDVGEGTVTVTSTTAGTVLVDYVVANQGAKATGRIRVDIRARNGNEPPTPLRDVVLAKVGKPVIVDVLGNDTDLDGDVLLVTAVDGDSASGVSAAPIEHRYVRVVPLRSSDRAVELTYVVSDGVAQARGSLQVRIEPAAGPNRAPLTTKDRVTVRAGSAASVPVLANDTDPDGDSLTLVGVTAAGAAGAPQPSVLFAQEEGAATVAGERVVVQAPRKPGSYRIAYTVSDGGTQRTEVLVVSVRPDDDRNTPPRAATVEVRVASPGTAKVSIPLEGVDPDGDWVELRGLAAPAPLQVRPEWDAATGELLVTVPADRKGGDVFGYELVDARGARATGIVRVGIAPAGSENSPPVAVDDTVRARPGSTVRVDVLANDTDPDGDAVSLVSADEPARVEAGRVVVEVPQAGSLPVTYTVGDPQRAKADGTLLVIADDSIKGLAPVARDDLVATAVVEGSPVDVDVRANDDDPDGASSELVVSLPGSPAGAEVVGGLVKVTPAAGPRVVAYQVTDADGLVSAALVRVRGTRDNPPVLTPGTLIEAPAGQKTVIALGDVVTDPEGQAVRVASATSAKAPLADPSVELIEDESTLAFQPAKGARGDTYIAVEVTDAPAQGKGQTALVVIPVRITGVNTPPALRLDRVVVEPGQGADRDLRAAALDPDEGDRDRLVFALGPNPPQGAVTASLNGDTLTISAEAQATKGTKGVVDLTVSDGKDEPVPVRVEYEVVASTLPLTVAVADIEPKAEAGQEVRLDVLANDKPPSKDFPELTITDLSRRDVARWEGSTVIVTPPPGVTGTIAFTYTVRDYTGDPTREVQGQVKVVVRDVPGTPGAPQVLEVRRGEIDLTWDAPTDDGGAPVEAYVVSGGGTQQECPATTCTLKGLDTGTTYAFTVVARNEVGPSKPSGASAPTLPLDVPPVMAAPTAPFDKALPGRLTVSWQSVPAQYEVQEYLVQQKGGERRSATGSSIVWSGLTPGEKVQFQVCAVSAARKADQCVGEAWSELSDPEATYVLPSAAVAAKPEVRNTKVGGEMTVTWSAPDSNGGDDTLDYTVRLIPDDGGAVVTDTVSNRLSAALPVRINVDYQAAVDVTNEAGTTAGPRSAAARSYQAPDTPSLLGVDDSGTGGAGLDGRLRLRLRMGFDGGKPIESLRVRVNGSSRDIAATASMTSAMIDGLANGTGYTFAIAACNDPGNCSDFTGESSSFTPFGPPRAPAFKPAIVNGTSVTVQWERPTDNGRPVVGYEVNVNSGGWSPLDGPNNTSVTLGTDYEQTYSVSVRTRDEAGQRSSVASGSFATGPRPVPQRQVVVEKGPERAGYPGYFYIVIRVSNFGGARLLGCQFSTTDGDYTDQWQRRIDTDASGYGDNLSNIPTGTAWTWNGGGTVNVNCEGTWGAASW